MEIYFGKNVEFLRKEFNKTQTDIGLQVSKNQKIISNWERGKTEPTLIEIGIISNYFDISADNLLFKDLSSDNSIENKGEPDKTKKNSYSNSENTQTASTDANGLLKVNELQESTISILNNTINDKNSIILMLTAEIDRLKEELQKRIQDI